MAHKTAEGQMIRRYQVDGDFVEIMGLRMVQGRALTDEPADAQAVVINETAARIMGSAEPLDKTIQRSWGWGEKRVVGVIEDFHFDGPRSKVEPLMMAQVDQWVGVILVRARPRPSRRRPQGDRRQVGHRRTLPPLSSATPLEEISAKLYSEES